MSPHKSTWFQLTAGCAAGVGGLDRPSDSGWSCPCAFAVGSVPVEPPHPPTMQAICIPRTGHKCRCDVRPFVGGCRGSAGQLPGAVGLSRGLGPIRCVGGHRGVSGNAGCGAAGLRIWVESGCRCSPAFAGCGCREIGRLERMSACGRVRRAAGKEKPPDRRDPGARQWSSVIRREAIPRTPSSCRRASGACSRPHGRRCRRLACVRR